MTTNLPRRAPSGRVRLRLQRPHDGGLAPFIRCAECTTVAPVHAGDIKPGTLRAIKRELDECLGRGWLKD